MTRAATPPPSPTPPPAGRLTRRLALTAALALPACATGEAARIAGPPKGRVVLLRGLINIFSTGMDALGEELRRAGWQATVHNHIAWKEEADELLGQARDGRLRGLVAVAGHSLGGDDAIRFATDLGGRGIALDLLITFDAVMLGTVMPGPRNVVNYYQTTGLWGRPLYPAPGFTGVLENIPVERGMSVNHFNIDKDPDLHRDVLRRLEALRNAPPPTRTARRRPRPPAPTQEAYLPLPPRPPVREGR